MLFLVQYSMHWPAVSPQHLAALPYLADMLKPNWFAMHQLCLKAAVQSHPFDAGVGSSESLLCQGRQKGFLTWFHVETLQPFLAILYVYIHGNQVTFVSSHLLKVVTSPYHKYL